MAAAAVRFSGHTIVEESELICGRAGPRAGVRPEGAGSLAVSTLARSLLGLPLLRAASGAPTGWGSPPRPFALSLPCSVLSPWRQKVDDSVRAGRAWDSGG